MPRIPGGAPPPSAPRKTEAPAPAEAPPETAEPQPPPRPSGWAAKLGNVAARVREELDKNLVHEASRTRSVDVSGGATVNGIGLSASAKLDGRVVLQKDDALIAGDSRRRASAQSGERVWTQVDATVSSSAGIGAPAAAGLTASFGLSGSVALTAIVPDDRGDAVLKGLGRTAARQGEGLLLTLDPDLLAQANLPPGSELMLSGSAAATFGLGAGYSSATPFERESAGASVSAGLSDQFVKNVKVLGDGKVWAQVTRADAVSLGGSVSVDAAASSAGVQGSAPGLGQRAENRVATRLEDQVNRRVELTASAGASVSDTGTLQIGGVFDLNTDAGRKAFAYLMNANPLDLQAKADGGRSMLINMGMGVAYSDDTVRSALNGTLRVGHRNVFQLTSASHRTQGTLLQADPNGLRETRITEAQYDREVSGDLARLANGEERRVTVRANGIETDAGQALSALARLTVDDPTVTAQEQQGWTRMALALGQTLPATQQTGGTGHFDLQLELSGAGLERLAQRDASDFKLAFDAAQTTVDGEPPPWNNGALAKKVPYYRYAPQQTVKQAFDSEREGWEWLQSGSAERADRIRDYRAATGRDLEKDVASFEARERFPALIRESVGRDVKGWGDTVEELGKLPSSDLRTELLALHRLGGASLVSIDFNANGASLTAAGPPASPSAGSIVGPVLRNGV